MTTKRYYTVVYEITDEESFAKHVAPLAASLSINDEDGNQVAEGLRVVACGEGDTMTAYDALAEYLDNEGHHVDSIIMDFCNLHEIDGDATIG